MVNRFMVIAVFVPLAVILVALAVANRGFTSFTIDPFNPGNPSLTISLPLFVLLFLAMALGLIIGGAATWLKQGRYRKLARQRDLELQSLRAVARTATAAPALPKPGV